MKQWMGLLVISATLAGCADGAPLAPADDPLDDLQLDSTADTGIIRGVVVDETIAPSAGVVITLEN
jgi:hypothetical protein